MAFFKKKTFYPPEVGETTIRLAGIDIMYICTELGYLKPVDTYQEAWSEYMKVEYALTLLVISHKYPKISDDFKYFLENTTKARIKSGTGTELLKKQVSSDAWYKDVDAYMSIQLESIPVALYEKILPLLPFMPDVNQKANLSKYLDRRIPVIYQDLMKLKFGIYNTRVEVEAVPPVTY